MPKYLYRFVIPLLALAALGAVPIFSTSRRVVAETGAQATTTSGDTSVPTAEPATFDVVKIATLTGGARYNVDAEFSKRVGRDVPVFFTLTVPTTPRMVPMVEEKPEVGLIKFNFVTTDPEPRLIENLLFFDAAIPQATEAERIQALGNLLDGKAFTEATKGFEQATKVALRRVQVGSYIAVELSGSYFDKRLGAMNLRLVAIPDPDSTRAVIVISNGVAKLMPLSTPDQLADTFAGRVLSTFRFLPQS